MKIALICIATGKRYRDYAADLIVSARKHFSAAEIVLFTDAALKEDPDHVFQIEPRGYPDETLMRYYTILTKYSFLRHYDQIFYTDADMLFVDDVDNIYSTGITATLHPGFFGHEKRGIIRHPLPGERLMPGPRYVGYGAGTPEARPASKAFLTGNEFYYCGGFQGGDSFAFLQMGNTLANNICVDLSNGIKAIWNDESHLNRYLHDNPPAATLSPRYCFPEGYDGKYGWSAEAYPPVLIARNKGVR